MRGGVVTVLFSRSGKYKSALTHCRVQRSIPDAAATHVWKYDCVGQRQEPRRLLDLYKAGNGHFSLPLRHRGELQHPRVIRVACRQLTDMEHMVLRRICDLEQQIRTFMRKHKAKVRDDLGLAAPDWAIAETGTLVYAATAEQTRSVTLLPAVHLAIVDSSHILPDLLDLPANLAERSVEGVLPRNVALVTGPSKTGDIELRLTTGVHGPGEVHVLIWQGEKGPS